MSSEPLKTDFPRSSISLQLNGRRRGEGNVPHGLLPLRPLLYLQCLPLTTHVGVVEGMAVAATVGALVAVGIAFVAIGVGVELMVGTEVGVGVAVPTSARR